MQFYDIKPLLNEEPFNLFYTTIFIIIWLVVYWLLFIKNKNTQTTKQEYKNIYQPNFNKEIEDLNQNINLPTEIFYKKLNKILKDIIYFKSWKNVSNLTYQEIEKLDLDDMFKDLLKSTYFKEYAPLIEDNPDIRKKYINNLKILVSELNLNGISK